MDAERAARNWLRERIVWERRLEALRQAYAATGAPVIMRAAEHDDNHDERRAA